MTALGHANWDLTTFYASLDDYTVARDALDTEANTLLARVESLAPLTNDTRADWIAFILDVEHARAQAVHVEVYVYCRYVDNVRDDTLGREVAHFGSIQATLNKVYAQTQIALAAAEQDAIDALIEDEQLVGADYIIGRWREAGSKRMSPELESLAADLATTGISAWSRLYNATAGSLTFEMPGPDGPTSTPMALRNSLLASGDPETRALAFSRSNAEWQRLEDIFAAALNSIAGERLTLYKRRGVEHFLDQALFDAGISRKTLDAMLTAIRESYELPRRFLRMKAQLMGKAQLGFWDIHAPMPTDNPTLVPWSEATSRVVDSFSAAYPKLGQFADRALQAGWIESEVRDGKSPGGFCAGSMVNNETRIFMTYNGTLSDIQTLAHELGHAFHHEVMGDQRALAREYPMTLAETASIFAETVFTDALLSDETASDETRLAVLDTRLSNFATFLLNIPMRFLFERAFYEARAEGEVSAARMKELMLDAQRETYGDVLDPEGLDPYFWASKLHFYISEISFYNFPYTFGYLFSLGVYAQRERLGDAFESTYERLLRATGSGTAEQVARDIVGIDLESSEFWKSAIEVSAGDLTLFEELLAKR